MRATACVGVLAEESDKKFLTHADVGCLRTQRDAQPAKGLAIMTGRELRVRMVQAAGCVRTGKQALDEIFNA